ncbi:family 20 glycosylhydrolase [Luteolibacter ambystomatis]|uniref:Family 20 glycosylhydrolase n=1 Tax=Luteolibacter ambystomatis TaxID=2824561 RepID=A0A975J263_9BACT|nr:family 20 glycosylhydrolase [Luteolibacter ambystomatis]QUE52651.1 family 20 glycosylhydrolase [Luteolibacter ambystomatis]
MSLHAEDLAVVPAVRSWKAADGTFNAKGGAVTTEGGSKALEGIAGMFSKQLATATGGTPATEGPKIVLTLDRAGHVLKPGGYAVEIGERLVIRGADEQGLRNGMFTVLQLAAHDPVLPHGTIEDWPSVPRRMLMLDVARKPFPLPVLKDYLRMMAWYKLNELHLHLSDESFGGGYAAFRVESAKFPGLAAKDLFYTKRDLRELQDMARGLGITITPEIDMPGHSRCFTNFWPDLALPGKPDYMDVTNPKTVERMKELLDEMIPLFDAPDFHIGTDEYRVEGSKERKAELHEAFRKFINTMNAHVRSRGKNMRIWSGFENMGGTTAIDPSITIDMWETNDAKSQIAAGHKVINSSDGTTYIVPGAHYYGVSNGGVYQNWQPWRISGDPSKNPGEGDPGLLGGKLHVWNDQGPTGYTMTEIASLTFPSIQAFSEKMWGTKGSTSYAAFQKRAALIAPVPGVQVFDRIPAKGPEGLVLDLPGERTLDSVDARQPLAFQGRARADLEYPWTLTMEIRKTADTERRGVILSSGLAEICADYSRTENRKSKGTDDKEITTKETLKGIGIVRAAGTPGADPASSFIVGDVSRVYGPSPAKDKWVKVAVVGDERKTTVFLDGVKVGESNNQMLCPLALLGSPNGNSFVGTVRNLKVFNRACSAKEIGRAAGLDMPDNLAAGAAVSASVSDDEHDFTPDKAVDGSSSSRWSSGPTGSSQWLAVDLGSGKEFNAIDIAWEAARPGQAEVEVSQDGKDWKPVAAAHVEGDRTRIGFQAVQARHVRIVMKEPVTSWGYSIFELEVMKRTGK